ncbi:hypothetical protein CIN_19400 [Commensalibacter intestini A911]|uniref:HEPN domain-containing protein n=1 Tax=Commensalibacter intestini A911 TaxID=1088868 RepID=G6F2U4_9PROT|nr:hypothetical protein [Commensalibacter intestini]EHD13203.1 hypothetical protein CIN_19400 [Commensalibacter intestini A911]
MSAREKTFREELDNLIKEGDNLLIAINHMIDPDSFKNTYYKNNQEKYNNLIKSLPSFINKYEIWYSKSKKVIKFILPDRLIDFNSAYKHPSKQKDITFTNYDIHNFILGIQLSKEEYRYVVVNIYQQQLNILKAAKKIFSSKLLDLKTLVQADLFDSEIEVAGELAKKGFLRGAGAICGVIIEKHLRALCERHNITITKKNPGINDLCVILRNNDVIDIPQERFIMSCADIRNLCDHNKGIEPTQTQIDNLLSDTKRIIDTIY